MNKRLITTILSMGVAMLGLTLLLTPEAADPVFAQSSSCEGSEADVVSALVAFTLNEDNMRGLLANVVGAPISQIDVNDPDSEVAFFSQSYCFDNNRRVPYCAQSEGQVCVKNGTDWILVPSNGVSSRQEQECFFYNSGSNKVFDIEGNVVTSGQDPYGFGLQGTFGPSYVYNYYLTGIQDIAVETDNNGSRVYTSTSQAGANTIIFYQILKQTLGENNLLDLLEAAMLSDNQTEKSAIFTEIMSSLYSCSVTSSDPYRTFLGDFVDYGIGDVTFNDSCAGVQPSCSFSEAPTVRFDYEASTFNYNTKVRFRCAKEADSIQMKLEGDDRILSVINPDLIDTGAEYPINGVAPEGEAGFSNETVGNKVKDVEFGIYMDGVQICGKTSDNPSVDAPVSPNPLEWGGLQGSEACQIISDQVQVDSCLNCLKANGTWTALGCIITTPTGVFTFLIQIAIGVMGGVALLRMIYLGYLYQTGEDGKIKEAQQGVVSIIGAIFVVVFSIVILRIIGVNILDVVPAGFFG